MQRSSTVSETGTTTLPKPIRVALGLDGGGRIEWCLHPNGHLVVRVKHRYIEGAVVPVHVEAAGNRMIRETDTDQHAAPSCLIRPPTAT
jgi:bifunctional DNA-binding transcriptional regulator/antitoxin component of YhaV-PrlF toxin-antitoxin module